MFSGPKAIFAGVYTVEMLRTRLLKGPGLFCELESSWKNLIDESPSATPFQTFEWQSTWWKHYGGLREPLAFALYENDDLVGLMPFVRSRGPWRTLRPMGIGPSDYLQPVVRSGYEERMSSELMDWFDQIDNVDLIDLQQLRETQPLAQREGSPIEQANCLVLDLPTTYDDYLKMLGKSLRYDVKRLDKKLFTEGAATLEPAGASGLEVLFEQHRKRWRKRGLPGAFIGRSSAFHREWAPIADRNGWLWLSVLKKDAKPIGAIYAMTLHRSTYYYQAGFDPEEGSISPGTLLVAATIRRSIEEGKTTFDFMRGDEPYKRRWKPQHAYRNLRFLSPAKGVLGRLGTQWNLTGSRVEGHVRARLEGRGLL
jgi:CelD/BcsL family acetyltransferase involved in cellulose biosynthesis